MWNESKAMLPEDALEDAAHAHRAIVGEFLDPGRPRANVIGLGVGVKWTNGEPTGEPALIALVTEKVPRYRLRAEDRIPARLGRMRTDVLAVGTPIAGGGALAAGVHGLTRRVRPAHGGLSVAHVKVTAGTIATCAYDILPGGDPTRPLNGVGKPDRYYLLSNNHVLADNNRGRPGDSILQPGPYDGGAEPQDRIGALSRFVPIYFDPPISRRWHRNLVDAAVAEARFADIEREVYWIGRIQGWRPKANVNVGVIVQKTGRTTGYTTGRITAINVTIDIRYRAVGAMARFTDQIVTTALSAGGDSGSLVMTTDRVAVGLLFAGSPIATVSNQIEHVRSLLEIELAEGPG